MSGDKAFKDRVIFTVDLLDDPYKNYPASWPGIFISRNSRDNSFVYATIINAYQGIVIEGLPPASHSKLLLQQCIIENVWDDGLLAINRATELKNCLISNCGKNVQLIYGGEYIFTHYTIASFSNLYVIHKEPVVLVTDGIALSNTLQTAPLKASFINNIC